MDANSERLFSDVDQGIRHLWFPDERGAQVRPPIIKMEVRKPQDNSQLFEYTVYIWYENRPYRITVRDVAPEVATTVIALTLEEWFNDLP